MKKIVAFFFIFTVWITANAQLILLDSIPIRITDTISFNRNITALFSSLHNTVDSTATLCFYEKTFNETDTPSIWVRNLDEMNEERVFLQSENGTMFKNPVYDNANILWCIAKIDSQFDIYGFKFDSTLYITDTIRITNDNKTEKTICYSESFMDKYKNEYLYWITEDSLLISQKISFYNYNNDSIILLTRDTIDFKCINLYPDFIYTKHEDSTIAICKLTNNGIKTIDKGNITYVNSSINDDQFLSLIYCKNDTFYVYDTWNNTSYPLIRWDNSPYVLPAFFSSLVLVKFIPSYLFVSTFQDSSNVISIAPQCGWTEYNEIITPSTVDEFRYSFPQGYEIKEVKIIPHCFSGPYTHVYIFLGVQNTAGKEVLYFFRALLNLIGDIKSQDYENKISLYPSPANSWLTIDLSRIKDSHKFNITLYDINGNVILRKNNLNKREYKLDTSGIPSGNYILKFEINGKNHYTTKITVTH